MRFRLSRHVGTTIKDEGFVEPLRKKISAGGEDKAGVRRSADMLYEAGQVRVVLGEGPAIESHSSEEIIEEIDPLTRVVQLGKSIVEAR